MKNKEYIEYTYKHRKVVMLLAKKYFKNNIELLERIEYHDLDKLFMYLFYDKKSISKIHRDLSKHHENELEKDYLDYVEMVLDWESARYTKPDKPLNAYDTLINFYSNMNKIILPILKEMGIDKPNLPMDEDILNSINQINQVTEEDIEKEMTKYIKKLLKK